MAKRSPSKQILGKIAPQAVKAQRVFLDLRSKILSGHLPADSRLTLRPLASQFGTGINAVSEAIKALAAEGLVELEGKAGARVIPRNLKRVWGDFTLRIALECEVARQCAVRADDIQLSVLESLAVKVDSLFAEGDRLELCRAADIQFHLALAECAGVPQIRETLLPLLDRLVSLDQTEARSAEIPGQKHIEVYEGLQSRDPVVASNVMRQHLEHSMNLSLAVLYF
ncbi:GntR family transcriptional regulator [Planctomicrobium sp. SH661]|uniref:GntR family transcriptional regulator n=1 Tax=Planctomicrobium sp. SH661 TaxID=3448124 RepID=UPI003F5C6EE8